MAENTLYFPTDDIGVVETKTYTCPRPFYLECGKELKNLTIAYETYGKLNQNGDNAILVLHALTGDAHAAGVHKPGEKLKGWWDPTIGPGRPFDTNKYFVVCSNVIGGCQGSTGPSSINPDTGKPYAMDFPVVTIRDMVRAQKELLDYLGVTRLVTAAGGSMGGMQALEWAIMYPEFLDSVIVIAAPGRVSPQAIAYNHCGRQAIVNDPKWNKGNYYDGEPPNEGLALARMIGTITYKSEESMNQRFSRTHCGSGNEDLLKFDNLFEVESYLNYQGYKLTKRFDANSYLYLSKAIDLHDVGRGRASYEEALRQIKAKTLVIGVNSDILYPVHQQKEIVDILKQGKRDAAYWELDSPYGHDAFLIEFEKMNEVMKKFMDGIESTINSYNKRNPLKFVL